MARIQKPSANIFSNILVGYPSPFIFVYLQVFLNVFYGNYSCPRVIDITFHYCLDVNQIVSVGYDTQGREINPALL